MIILSELKIICKQMQNLRRRGFYLGQAHEQSGKPDTLDRWQKGYPILLPGICNELIEQHRANISDTERLVLAVLQGESAEDLLDQPPYQQRLQGKFEPLGSAYNEGDEQEVETVMFDAGDGTNTVAEDLWMKISWLSFFDEDASIRFRFSFGVDLEEDVAADPIRQNAAAALGETIFPESAIITQNDALISVIKRVIDDKQPSFVERILYFNAPEGGAYLHHDLERGHAGVAYAQISGSTLWLALPHHQLVEEIVSFARFNTLPGTLSAEQQKEVAALVNDRELLSAELNSFANDALIHLINETEEFVQFLIANGHCRVLSKGDAILLPQKNQQLGCWHSVFCLGEEMGQALSFAIR